VPPWFAYIMLLIIWGAGASVAWAVFGVMAIFPTNRRTAGRAAISVLGSLPGMVLLQALAFPFCLVPLAIASSLSWLLGPQSRLADKGIVVAGILAVGMFAVASFFGLWAGSTMTWRMISSAEPDPPESK
jgi:hypothetical protein